MTPTKFPRPKGQHTSGRRYGRKTILKTPPCNLFSYPIWNVQLADWHELAHAAVLPAPLIQGDIMTILDTRKRHAELVDKKYLEGLIEEEEAELEEIKAALDEADSIFYQPVLMKLHTLYAWTKRNGVIGG